MPSVQDEIRSRVDAFVSELTTLVRQAALETLSAALGEQRKAPAAALAPAPKATASRPRPRAAKAKARRAPRRAAAPPARTETRPAPAPKASAPPAGGGARKKGQKRDPAELAQLGERLYEYIKANPRQRMEVIQVALGVPAAELKFPIKQLRASNRITSTGMKQATTYTAR